MANTYECVVMKEAYGGKGEVRLEMLLGETELKDKCGLFARVTIPAGSSLGYHEHHGNGESYYIISGHARIDSSTTTKTWYKRLKVINLPRYLVVFKAQ